jgi:hypothetical protein
MEQRLRHKYTTANHCTFKHCHTNIYLWLLLSRLCTCVVCVGFFPVISIILRPSHKTWVRFVIIEMRVDVIQYPDNLNLDKSQKTLIRRREYKTRRIQTHTESFRQGHMHVMPVLFISQKTRGTVWLQNPHAHAPDHAHDC